MATNRALALLAALAAAARPAAAFAPPSAPLAVPNVAPIARCTLSGAAAARCTPLQALPNEPDYDEAYEDDDDDEDDGLDSLYGKKLGINIGAQLPSLSKEEIADIKAAAQETLDAAIDSRLADIEELREELQDELAESRSRMETAAELNVQLEKQNLMEKIDKLSNDFLNKDKDFRESTKRAADADKLAGSTGRGVDWGSWGNLGDGEVVITSEGIKRGGGASKLLGSVDAARRRGRMLSADDEEEEGEEEAVVVAPAENRVLVVVDDKKVGCLQSNLCTSCALFLQCIANCNLTATNHVPLQLNDNRTREQPQYWIVSLSSSTRPSTLILTSTRTLQPGTFPSAATTPKPRSSSPPRSTTGAPSNLCWDAS